MTLKLIALPALVTAVAAGAAGAKQPEPTAHAAATIHEIDADGS
jgi:hypothetical protein